VKIYTKTGDSGETSLFGGKRVSKSSSRIEAFGSIDELNSYIGLVRTLHPIKEIDTLLEKIQRELFIVGAQLAAVSTQQSEQITTREIEFMEQQIDKFEKQIGELKSFILPGGSLVAAHIQVARTICRRAERRLVTLNIGEPIDSKLLIYINRLSDFLFTLARYANKVEGRDEERYVRA